MIAADHLPGLEATIFNMDIRAHGKDFDQYYERAKKQGVNYVKGIPSRIIQMPGTKTCGRHSITKPINCRRMTLTWLFYL